MRSERQEQKPQIFSIGYVVGAMRTRLEIPQTDLAKYVGTTQDHISRIERNKAVPSWELLLKFFAVANSEEADALLRSMIALPARDRRRDDMARAIKRTTAALRRLTNYDLTPNEAEDIMREIFGEVGEGWLNNTTTLDEKFSTRL